MDCNGDGVANLEITFNSKDYCSKYFNKFDGMDVLEQENVQYITPGRGLFPGHVHCVQPWRLTNYCYSPFERILIL